MKKLKIVDLFSGVGGLSYSFAYDNYFKIVAANEILTPMANAYRLNHKDVKVYNTDIKNFGLIDLEDDFNIKKGDIDIVIGGPPCQAYSTVGRRIIDDPRGKLFQEYFRIIQELEPKFFLFENVKGLISMSKGELLPTIIELFKSINYNVKYSLLNAADYGTPQTRERLIIIGSKISDDFEFPKPTHSKNPKKDGLLPYLKMKDALSDLPLLLDRKNSYEYISEPVNDYQRIMRIGAPEKIQEHVCPKNNEKLIEIMKFLPEGGTPKDLPENLKPTSGFGNTYSKLWWNKPSTTITRNLSTPSSSRCIHPLSPRALTTREGARLQGFPDNYIFVGSMSEKNLQIGNAVPTLLSKALKESIKKHFNIN